KIALTKNEGADPETIVLRRRLAVLALANLPENLKYLDTLTSDSRETLLRTLEAEAGMGSSERGQWAMMAAEYVKTRQAGQLQALGVDQVLRDCIKPGNSISDDPILRGRVAFALTFWEGSREENERMENTLVQLSFDDGHGAEAGTGPIR